MHPDTAILVDLALGGRYNREGTENTELVLNSNNIPLDNRIWGEKNHSVSYITKQAPIRCFGFSFEFIFKLGK